MQPSRCVELVGQKGPNGQAGWLMAFRAGGLIHFSLEVLQMFSGGQLDHGKCDECAGSSMLHPHCLPGLCVHCQALKSSLSYLVRANISCKGEHNPSSPRPNWNNWNPFFLHSANLPCSPRTPSICVSQPLSCFWTHPFVRECKFINESQCRSINWTTGCHQVIQLLNVHAHAKIKSHCPIQEYKGLKKITFDCSHINLYGAFMLFSLVNWEKIWKLQIFLPLKIFFGLVAIHHVFESAIVF